VKVLRINIGTWPDVLDPQKSSFVGEIAVLQMVYEGLVRLNEKGEVVPGAAEKWETASDGKSMTFHLRAGLKRADGTPLTAKDFEYAYKRLVDPRVQGEYNTLIDDVVGAVEARSMDPKSSDADIQKALDKVGVKATDDRTLVVTFNKPVGYWSMIAYTWVGWPSDPKIVAKDPENWWNKAEGHNGNGPWKISKYEENKTIQFVPNPNYWGPKPKLNRIEFYFITESAVSFAAYQKGELDVVGLAPEDLATVQADPVLSKEFFRGPAAWVTYMGMHNKKPPFNDKAVREAFAMAFDRDTFVKDILKGAAKTYLSWVPPGVPGYDPTAVQKGYDPEGAVKKLIDAGYGTPDGKKVDCKKLGELKITYSGTSRNHARFQYIAGNFAKVFGCPVTLDPVDPTVFTSLVKKVETAPQIFLLGWVQDYPHPQNWLFIMACDGLFANRIGYCNPEFDKALAAANAETDQAKAIELYKAAQKIFLNDYPGAMLYYNENWYLIKPYVLGLKEHYSTSDAGWPGQFGPIETYDIDLSKVGPGYPTK
jgi:oligopeptide transport system substrate-binding protein